ncbi:MAG TPA: carbamoyl-phosphate-synthetase [Porphyromonadaceae bacterium]|jgi:biotin carboxylase|nr:carbamoyl-phosphate-synthetase [Porphyromonadaceae bacterium]
MKQKRILFLGGAYAQMPIIEEAKSRGWYIITCDYLPDNPGHKLADEYYNISTTDQKKVLDLAQKVKSDFVVAYASDPAAPVAAYVSEQLGLPGNTYKSVQLLSEKDKFRSFLSENGFNTPKHISIEGNNIDYKALSILQFPVIVKPTDSSGSKGVSKVEIIDNISSAVEYSLQFSRNKRAIVEEFIDNSLGDIHGDGFVVDGELVFVCLGDHIYNGKVNPYNPTGTYWPSKISRNIVEMIENDVAKIIQKTGFKNGGINIEARINSKGKSYIMEIGPRNGGHFVPQALKYATGFDMVSAYLDLLERREVHYTNTAILRSAYIALHSDVDGILDSILIDDELQPYIKEFHQYIRSGEEVKSFEGANAAIGILLLTFPDTETMDQYIREMDTFVNVKLK